MLLTPKMFSSWLRQDVKKILKRKDSDAGERGKALEDLRASLFNRFRSPETPKRQQQQQHRICGPTVALTFNFVVAISIIFMNKWVLKNIGFEFPVFLTFIHYIVAYLLMALLKSFSLLPASPPSTKSSLLPLYTLGIVMSLSTGLANVSLKYNRFWKHSLFFCSPLFSYIALSHTVSHFVVFVSQCWILPDGENCCYAFYRVCRVLVV
jgi:hypothetical protein